VLLKILNQRNACVDASLMRRYEVLYRGGADFQKCIKWFLSRNHSDNDQMYAERVKVASYRSYVGPIVDYYCAQLFAAPYNIRAVDEKGEPLAKVDEFYSQFREDCDGLGSDLTSFIKATFLEAVVKKTAYIVAQMPSTEGMDAMTRREYLERGLDRCTVRTIPSESILDWEVDPVTGDYQWLVAYSTRSRRPSIAAATVCEHTWTVYEPTTCKVYQRAYAANQQPKPEDDIPLVEEYPHGFSRVPVLPLTVPDGLWILNRCASAQVEHFQLSAALGWLLRRSAYPMGIFNVQEVGKSAITGAGMGHYLGLEEKFHWEEPEGKSAAILQAEIEKQKDEIYRVSAQMAMSVNNSAAGLGRSGLSKMADASATEICLRGYSVVVKDALEKLYEMVSDARGDYDVKWAVEGLNQFSLIDATTLIENAKLAQDLGIPSDTFKKELYFRVAEALMPSDLAQSVKDAIREEIMSADVEPPSVKPAVVVGAEVDEEPDPRTSEEPTSDSEEEPQ